MSLLEALNQEWEQMISSPRIRRGTASWNDPSLERLGDPGNIVEFVQQRGHPLETDDVFRALVQLAPTDDLAARTVLHALMPGFRNIARRYSWAAEQDEVASMVVAAGFEQIRCYPLNRRPHRIAANIVADTRRSLHDRLVKGKADEMLTPALDDRADVRPRSNAADKVTAIVSNAVRTGVVSKDDGRLIVETRVFDKSIESLTAQQGLNAQSLRRRRLRAETAIRGVELSIQ